MPKDGVRIIGGGAKAARESVSKAKIDIATATTHSIIAAPGAGIKIKILKIFYVCAAAVDVTLKSGTTAITGVMSHGATGGLGADTEFTPIELTANEAFQITLGGAVQVSGLVLYVEEA